MKLLGLQRFGILSAKYSNYSRQINIVASWRGIV